MSKISELWRKHAPEFEALAAASQRSVSNYEVAVVNALREARLAASRLANAPGEVGDLWRGRSAILDRAYRECGLHAWDGPRD